MPTYEYVCTSCGQHVEVVQRISEPSLTTCGVCGGSLRKVFHPAGILFKGSGFYATDNRRAKAPAESGSDRKPEPKTDSKSGAKSDSAAAAKPAAKEKSA
jgi:putative FmdB family regulatory protein